MVSPVKQWMTYRICLQKVNRYFLVFRLQTMRPQIGLRCILFRIKHKFLFMKSSHLSICACFFIKLFSVTGKRLEEKPKTELLERVRLSL